MIRALANLILMIAYLAGLLLLWAGFEDLTAKGAALAVPLVEIGVAIAWWDLLTVIGRWLSTRREAGNDERRMTNQRPNAK